MPISTQRRNILSVSFNRVVLNECDILYMLCSTNVENHTHNDGREKMKEMPLRWPGCLTAAARWQHQQQQQHIINFSSRLFFFFASFIQFITNTQLQMAAMEYLFYSYTYIRGDVRIGWM